MAFAIRFMLAAVALAVAGSSVASDKIEVDLELVLAVDVSGSMDAEEHELQRMGYVEALAHPEIWSAVETGAYQRIAVIYVEWAGAGAQQVVLPWRLIDSAEAARAFAEELARQPISDIRGTSISGAIDFAVPLFDSNEFESYRKVIDISGDGPNNRGRPVLEAREEALARGVTINGLPIMLRSSTGRWAPLDDYYADCVIGGPAAFILPVTETGEMTVAIRRKLVLEIATAPHIPAAAAAHAMGPEPSMLLPAQSRGRSDCLIGERQRRYFLDP